MVQTTSSQRFKTSLIIFSEIYEHGVVPPNHCHFALGQNLFILIKFKEETATTRQCTPLVL